MMYRTFTPIRDANPLFGRPQTNDVRPDHAYALLVPPHATDFPLIVRLDGGFNPHGVKIDRQSLGHLWMLGLAGTGIREQSDVDRARGITRFLQQLFGARRVVPVEAVEAFGPGGVPAFERGFKAAHIHRL